MSCLLEQKKMKENRKKRKCQFVIHQLEVMMAKNELNWSIENNLDTWRKNLQ